MSLEYGYDRNSGRYRITKGAGKGKFISKEAIDNLTLAAIDQGYQRIEKLGDRLLNGSITLAQWERQTATELKDLHIASYLIGRGGLKVMDADGTKAADMGRIGRKLKDEYGYLRRFSQDIRDGKVTEKQFRDRSRRFADHANSAYETGRTIAHEVDGFIAERRRRNAAESCPSCIYYASLGWQSIGTLPESGENCECLDRCKCTKEYSKDRRKLRSAGFSLLPDGWLSEWKDRNNGSSSCESQEDQQYDFNNLPENTDRPMLIRAAADQKVEVDFDNRQLKLTFSSTHPVERHFWDDEHGFIRIEEVLSHEQGAIDSSRVKSRTCQFLDSHDRTKRLGRVLKIEVNREGTDRGEGLATIKLNRNPLANGYLTEVEDDTAPGISVGYVIHKMKRVIEPEFKQDKTTGRRIQTRNARYLAEKWSILEISAESVPADPTVGLRNLAEDEEELSPLPEYIGSEEDFKNLCRRSLMDSTDITSENSHMGQNDKTLPPNPSQSDSGATVSRSEFDQLMARVSGLETENTTLKTELKTKTDQLAGMERGHALAQRYTTCRTSAKDLLGKQLLSKAEFDQFFTEAASDDLTRMSQNIVASEQELANIEFYLRTVAVRTSLAPVQLVSSETGTFIYANPHQAPADGGNPANQTDEAARTWAEDYLKRNPIPVM